MKLASSGLEGVVPDTNATLMRILDKLAQLMLQYQQWELASNFYSRTLTGFSNAYASNSPLLGLQYLTCTKLFWYLNQRKRTIEYGQKASKILHITHTGIAVALNLKTYTLTGSESHAVMRECERILQEAELDKMYNTHLPETNTEALRITDTKTQTSAVTSKVTKPVAVPVPQISQSSQRPADKVITDMTAKPKLEPISFHMGMSIDLDCLDVD